MRIHILFTVRAQIPCFDIGFVTANVDVRRIGEHGAHFFQKSADGIFRFLPSGVDQTVGIDGGTGFGDQNGFFLIPDPVGKT